MYRFPIFQLIKNVHQPVPFLSHASVVYYEYSIDGSIDMLAWYKVITLYKTDVMKERKMEDRIIQADQST